MAQVQGDKAIKQAKQYVEEDTAKAAGRETVDIEKIKEESDELLDEIDSLLEETAIVHNFRQRGGQ